MKSFIFIALFLASACAFADGFKTEKETRNFSDQLVNQIISEKFQDTFNSAKPFWPMPEVEIDGIVNRINQQWPLVKQRFGKSVGIEFIRKESIGQSFIRYYYLHKFDNHAIYWRIDFYKPRDEWKMNGVIFLDSLDVLYE